MSRIMITVRANILLFYGALQAKGRDSLSVTTLSQSFCGEAKHDFNYVDEINLERMRYPLFLCPEVKTSDWQAAYKLFLPV